jgi:4,5-DOPA dioxygenase extradiol
MERKQFLQAMLAVSAAGTLSSFKRLTDELPVQGKRMPVLFTSHGNPMVITVPRVQHPFWNALHDLGKTLKRDHEVKAALVVSAHWCTRGTFVNTSLEQQQIYDYYGFPKEYYDPKYRALGAPEIAHEVKRLVPSVTETTEWGLDHGAWPMLMHLFPNADVPVFQLSLDYYAKPSYHYELGQQLKALRDKGVLIIGSGSLIHNLDLAMQKLGSGDMTPFGWEAEYDAWIKGRIDARDHQSILNYETSHKLGKLAAPTPDHFVPVLYSLGLMDAKDDVRHFFDGAPEMPAFSERSFIITPSV